MDGQNVYSIGAIAVAPSDENVVWVGTGDNSATRSAYWGDGVYRSTDAGKTWQNMGLKDTQHIARIVIHPTRPDTVWVAALGHLATPNQERGVFKTIDGGRTWQQVLYVGDRVGAVDLVRDPRNRRRPLRRHLRASAPRLGHQRWRSRHRHLQDDRWRGNVEGTHQRAAQRPDGPHRHRYLPHQARHALRRLRQPQPATGRHQSRRTRSTARSIARTMPAPHGGASTPMRWMSAARRATHSTRSRSIPTMPTASGSPDPSYNHSADGGRTWAGRGGPRTVRARLRRLPLAVGRSAGLRPHDLHVGRRSLPVLRRRTHQPNTFMSIRGGEVYALGVDMETPYNIYAGLQDHESWKGPSNGWSGSVGIEDWAR